MPIVIKSILLSLILLVMADTAAAITPPMRDISIRKANSAIFDAYLPFTNKEMDTSLKHLVRMTKRQTLKNARMVPQLKAALFLLHRPRLLYKKDFIKLYYRFFARGQDESSTITKEALKPVRDFLQDRFPDKVMPSIEDLSRKDRRVFIELLIRSDVNLLRQVGFYVRLFYTQNIYSSHLGEKISGIKDQGYRRAAIMPDLPKFKTDLVYSPGKRRLQGKIDAIIVGSGPAGATAAHELSKKGLSVVVVEQGPFVMPGSFDTISNFNLMENHGPRLSEDGSIALLNGRAVGGGTAVNLDMSFLPTLPMVRHRFHMWHQHGLIPKDVWTDQDIDRATKWVENIFKPRTIQWHEINSNNAVLIRGAVNSSIPFERYQLNQYWPDDSPYSVNAKKGSLDQLLIPAMLNENTSATLLSDCRVRKVLMKDNKAYGVECLYQPSASGFGILNDIYRFRIRPQEVVRIYADKVILAAGNLGTSSILLKSRIHNKNIGRGFVAHPFVSIMGRFEKPIRAYEGEPSSIYVDHFMPTDKNPDQPGYLLESGVGHISLWALLMPGSPKQMKENYQNIDRVASFSVMLTDTPSSESRIEVAHDGRAKVHYHLKKADRLRLIDGIKRSVEIMFEAGAKEVSFNTFEYPLFQNDGGFNTLTPDMDFTTIFAKYQLKRNQTSLVGAHMMAGNKMGTSPDTSVVNSDHMVWGTEGLYVIDSSIFPSSVGANPMQTIYACAKLFTERFLKAHNKDPKDRP